MAENKRILSVSTLKENEVVNHSGKNIGKIVEIMIDTKVGHIAYVVLSFGGFMGLGDKLFAIPWGAFALDKENKKFVLSVSKERLEQAEGFDKNDWPNMTDLKWGETIYEFYGYKPYWL